MKVIVWLCFISLFQFSLATIQHTMSGIAVGYNATTGVEPVDVWLGSKIPLLQLYDNFCGGWIWEYPVPDWMQRGIPMISFQPEQPTCGSTTPSGIATLIANGQYDTYLKSFIASAKSFLAGPNGIYGDGDDRRIYMRFAHEMNGNWYPWSGNTTAYKLMWIHFYNLVQQAGINSTRMQWVWCVNWQDIPASLTAEDYYPGDQYVDWVSLDGYNDANSQSWSHWMEPTGVFGPMVQRLVALAPNKPIGIAEVGCSTSGYTPADKSTWITTLYQYALQNNIRFVMWFNDEDGFTDYAVFGSRNGTDKYTVPSTGQTILVYDNYATQVNKNALPLDPSNPRIITDAEFAGNFS